MAETEYAVALEVDWLKEISEVPGISGFERPVRNLLLQRLQGIAEVGFDKLGSVLFTKIGDRPGPRVMVAAHMDEIGFLVKHITKEGFLRFTCIGGWWDHILVGMRVNVLAYGGRTIPGVIGSKPPHILPPDERKKMVARKDMYIDVGAANEEEVRTAFGIRPGDAVVPDGAFLPLANDKLLLGKAWDNRIGCAIMTETLRSLAGGSHPNTVIGVGTVQEEVGLRGAQTSVQTIQPDVAFVIDTCIAGDTPGVADDQAVSKLGKGVGISIFDASLIPQQGLRDFVIRVAEEEKIPYQLEFSEGGGTDGGKIQLQGQGVPTLVLGIPTRYIHSASSIIHYDDCLQAVRLLAAVLRRLDGNTLQQIL